MNKCKLTDPLYISYLVSKKYLRYSDEARQMEYGKALAYYLSYNDQYLSLPNIDQDLLIFLAKIVRNSFCFPKNQIAQITAKDIEEYFRQRKDSKNARSNLKQDI